MLNVNILDAMRAHFYVIAFGDVGWRVEAPLGPLEPVLVLRVGQAVLADGELGGGGEEVGIAWIWFEASHEGLEEGVGL